MGTRTEAASDAGSEELIFGVEEGGGIDGEEEGWCIRGRRWMRTGLGGRGRSLWLLIRMGGEG